MKNPCRKCGGTPKYKYGSHIYTDERHVILICDCGNATRICRSDPTALKRWNEENN